MRTLQFITGHMVYLFFVVVVEPYIFSHFVILSDHFFTRSVVVNSELNPTAESGTPRIYKTDIQF